MKIQCPECMRGQLNTMEILEAKRTFLKVKAGCDTCPNTEILEISIVNYQDKDKGNIVNIKT